MRLLPLNLQDFMITKSTKTTFITLVVAASIPVLLPFFHLGIISHLWDEFNYKVNKKDCSCGCWDTIFKGIYERGPAGYKHVYFNITFNTLKIWAVTVLAVILTYECVKKVCRLYFSQELRYTMLALLLCSIYPHYYSWWSYFNYWNDDFYNQWNHQLFFSFTELISSVMVVYLLDKNVSVTSRNALIIVSIAVLHILSSGVDQFIDNVVKGNGMLHQVLRDIFFMAPDLLQVSLPLLELQKVAKSRNVPTAHLISSKDFMFSVAFILCGWILCLIL